MGDSAEYRTTTEQAHEDNQPLDPRSLAEVTEEGQQRQQVIADLHQAETAASQADREAAIQAFIVENDFLGFDPKDDGMMEALTTILLRRETLYRKRSADFDICTRPVEYLRTVAIRAGMKADESAKTEDYQSVIESLKGKSGREILTILSTHEATPAVENEKANQYLRLLSPQLVSNEQDRALIQSRVDTLDFSAGVPDPIRFIQTTLFTEPTLSRETKQAIATEFGLSPTSIATGSDLIAGLRESVIDPTTGEPRPKYDRDHPLEYREGVGAYVDESGEKVLRVELADGRVREIPITTEDPTQMRTFASLLAIYGRLEEAGISHFMGEPFNIETDLYHQTDIDQTWRVAQVMEALLGGDAGYDGEIIWNDQLDLLVWESQFFSTKGDAAASDYDIERSWQNLQELGIRTPEGEMNFDILRAAGDFMRGQYLTGAPDYYGLQLYLHGLYPEQVPLTGENAEDDADPA